MTWSWSTEGRRALWLAVGQAELELGPDTSTVTSSSSSDPSEAVGDHVLPDGHLWEGLSGGYGALGFARAAGRRHKPTR
jgi:hypothetical protein